MTTTTHTPGPWCAPSAGIYAGTIGPDGYARGPMVADTGSRQITASMRQAGRDLNEQTANALLIAAAPDLLAAVDAALVLLCDPDADDFDAHRVEAVLAAAATKARGGA